MLDTRRALETPEGVELELRVAGPAVRGLAWAIDAAIRAGGYLALSMLLPFFGRFGFGLLLIAFFLVEWFYPVLFEVYRQGATPGKRSLGIQAIHEDGTPIGWSASLIRNLLRSVDFLPMFYGFGLASMLLNGDFKRLGDLAAGSLVVYSERPTPAPELPAAIPESPPQPLTTAEQRAIIQFAERAPALTPQRGEELADILEPLTGARGEQAVRRLFQYANWMVGRR